MAAAFTAGAGCGGNGRTNAWTTIAAASSAAEAFMDAKKLGITTWASVEPVIDPEDALLMIERLSRQGIVDFWKVGKLNHYPEIEAQIDWVNFRERAKAVLNLAIAEGKTKGYLIKKDLAVYGAQEF
jgi:hypothetical protein